MFNKIISSDLFVSPFDHSTTIRFSGDLIQDIQNSKDSPMSSLRLLELFMHYQAGCSDTDSYVALFQNVVNEIHEFLYPRISFEAIHFLSNSIIDRTKMFKIDDNVRSILPDCFRHTKNIRSHLTDEVITQKMPGYYFLEDELACMGTPDYMPYIHIQLQ